MYIHVPDIIIISLSEADLEAAMRKIYAIPADTMCRVWHQYMPDVCELLIDSQTLGNAGLFNMQVMNKKECIEIIS